ncbi:MULTISPECIES: YciI family protein [unclassified Tenacibaculum]|uniref:YciI family protein n=1 Tax=unclassified Tenacibaculum TaxID=2635139 RepID=UPI001F37DF22|nr:MULTISPECIES: YciI family protein [unclassified Tenacibaculum]MCF2874477.1 YciI family protein [Tenacibaculum sp. Cn5-1]MCF2934457.1 YciI family protein [Tenacibaculum sp. Cn5-34]MCG7510667.1 YciI family protein [Tenacibaculum sp. Cn5-46]
MKNFMMIFIGKEYIDLGLSEEDVQARMEKWFAWSNKMEQAGILRGGEALTPQIRRVVGKNRTITDLTSADVKEVVGGYFLVEAKDFNEVQEIAQDFPDYDLGNTVEIREIMVFDK